MTPPHHTISPPLIREMILPPKAWRLGEADPTHDYTDGAGTAPRPFYTSSCSSVLCVAFAYALRALMRSIDPLGNIKQMRASGGSR